MANLKLSLACWDYDRTRPLIDGRVKPVGIDLEIAVLRPKECFQRMLDNREFHVSELSLSSYTALRARGDTSLVGVPAAPSKIFRHSCVYIRKGAGIETPGDLRGKRVGTARYTSTGICYIRGALQHDYGVEPHDMRWFIGGLHAGQSSKSPNLHLPVEISLLSEHQTLEGMLETGALDALFSLDIPHSFERGDRHITRLWPHYKQVEIDYYRRTKIMPIMHTVVMRDDVLREHPWVAKSIYDAFCRAKALAVDGLYDTDALRLTLPFLIDHVEEARATFGYDFWAYGREANRPTWEAMARFVHEQGMAPKTIALEDLFPLDVES